MDENTLEQLNSLNQKNMDLLTSFSPWAIVGSLIYGVIGIWLFRRGKKELNHKVMVIGIILMIYPLFTMDALLVWAIGAVLCGFAYYWWDQ